jgi:hypothetical protein
MDRYEKRESLEHLVEAWEDADLDPAPLAPVEAAMRRIAEVGREVAAIPAPADVTRGLGERVAAGELSVADAIREHATETAGVDKFVSSMSRAYIVRQSAESAAIRNAVRALDDAGDVAALVEEARLGLVGELRKLASTLDGIASADDAVRAGGKVATTWARLIDLEEHRVALARCWANLASLGVVDPKDRPAEFAPGTSTVRLARRIASAEALV